MEDVRRGVNRNVGDIDRWIRIVVGVLVAAAGAAAVLEYWAAGIAIGVLALLVGAILLVTGATQTCPIYAGTGIDTLGEE